VVASLIVASVLALAQPAYAHAVFVNGPSAFPADTTQTLTMHVPNERRDTDYNVEVTVAIPAGWQPLSCTAQASWSCSLGYEAGRRIVHFVKRSGNVLDQNETFKYTVRTAATIGSFAFPTVQRYETGETVYWVGRPGSEEPAPVLRTIPGAAPPSNTTTTSVRSQTAVTSAPTTIGLVAAPTTAAATSTSLRAGRVASAGVRTSVHRPAVRPPSRHAAPSLRRAAAAASRSRPSHDDLAGWVLVGVLFLLAGAAIAGSRLRRLHRRQTGANNATRT